MKFISCCSTNPIKPRLIAFLVIKILFMCTHSERLSGCVDTYSAYISCYLRNVLFTNIIDTRGKTVKFIFNFTLREHFLMLTPACFIIVLMTFYP